MLAVFDMQHAKVKLTSSFPQDLPAEEENLPL